MNILSMIIKRNYSASFGFFFDIDGVFLKGKSVIPAAKNAFKLLLDKNGKWKVPFVFVTNAGNKLRKNKAEELTEKLGVYISPEQVVMSHSPLRMYNQFHKKRVLVCGQGPAKKIAEKLGFCYVYTMDDIKKQYPHLDVCSHDRPLPAPCAFERYNKPIEAIILFGEPIAWETNYQLLLDMLMTNGQPYKAVNNIYGFSNERVSRSIVPYPHIPLLACNMDMLWMAQAPLPRLGHGCFLNNLETLYEKLSGRKLYYTALIGKPSELTYHYSEYRLNQFAQDNIGWKDTIKRIYCVGDNPQTDIYGANLYNKYLETNQHNDISEDVRRIRQMVSNTFSNCDNHESINRLETGLFNTTRRSYNAVSNRNSNRSFSGYNQNSNNINNSQYSDSKAQTREKGEIKSGFAKACKSILVLTGVVPKKRTMDIKSMVELMSQSNVNHNHRDFPDYPELKNPTHVCNNVEEAIMYAFEVENYVS